MIKNSLSTSRAYSVFSTAPGALCVKYLKRQLFQCSHFTDEETDTRVGSLDSRSYCQRQYELQQYEKGRKLRKRLMLALKKYRFILRVFKGKFQVWVIRKCQVNIKFSINGSMLVRWGLCSVTSLEGLLNQMDWVQILACYLSIRVTLES